MQSEPSRRSNRYMSRHQIDVRDASYNGSYHCSIKMNTRNYQKRQSPIVETTVRPNGDQKENEPAYKKGDTVRIAHVRQPFDREYDERCTTVEYFVVHDGGASKQFYDERSRAEMDGMALEIQQLDTHVCDGGGGDGCRGGGGCGSGYA